MVGVDRGMAGPKELMGLVEYSCLIKKNLFQPGLRFVVNVLNILEL
jgi:hypothetical protein